VADISVRSLGWRQWDSFAPAWERVHCRCPEASFFLTREWVDCWLAAFGGQLNPELVEFTADGETVGCCLLVLRTRWVRGLPLRRVYLNCTGEDEADSTCSEYNAPLSLPGYAEPVARALAGALRKRRWDELLLNGVEETSAVRAAAASLGAGETSSKPSPYIDFTRVRENAGGFDAVLSSNTRQQIRRSRRLYEETLGPCAIRVAESASEADEALTRLAGLHQAAWTDRGRPGVFASERFTGFHRRLIRSAFPQGRILLAEALAGDEPIGALYSFLFRGRVYFYQSGFRYDRDSRLKPGLLTHYLAIQRCLGDAGLLEYDFLAGDAQYKRSLATHTRPLEWTVVRRATVPSLVFRGLRSVKRRYAELGKEGGGEPEPPGGRGPSANVSVPDREG
jgi:CelD/BcsL family acetyltransferase involved in cellulose biosynthesis